MIAGLGFGRGRRVEFEGGDGEAGGWIGEALGKRRGHALGGDEQGKVLAVEFDGRGQDAEEFMLGLLINFGFSRSPDFAGLDVHQRPEGFNDIVHEAKGVVSVAMPQGQGGMQSGGGDGFGQARRAGPCSRS